jgi:hypothetical protein
LVARAGLSFGLLALGAGVRKNNFTVETFPSGSPSRKIEFEELLPFFWVGATYFPPNSRIGFTMDSEYHFGTFRSQNYRFEQYDIGLKIHLSLK